MREDKAGGRRTTDPSWPGQSVASAMSGPQGGNWTVLREDFAFTVINRPGVARVVLQTPLLLIN